MMGLIRKAILIGGVIAAMPSPPPDGADPNQMATQSSLGASIAYVSAVGATVSDAKGFCARQPQVCSTAQYFATSLQGKARYSAKLIYQWANESGVTAPQGANSGQMVAQVSPKAEPVVPAAPATPALRKKTHVNMADNSDLRIEDLINDMHGTLPPAKDPKKG
jgi:hypothetical protein